MLENVAKPLPILHGISGIMIYDREGFSPQELTACLARPNLQVLDFANCTCFMVPGLLRGCQQPLCPLTTLALLNLSSTSLQGELMHFNFQQVSTCTVTSDSFCLTSISARLQHRFEIMNLIDGCCKRSFCTCACCLPAI